MFWRLTMLLSAVVLLGSGPDAAKVAHLVSALEEPDVDARNRVAQELRALEASYPKRPGAVERLDPTHLVVHGGLVLSPAGQEPGPYHLRLRYERSDDTLVSTVTVNSIILFAASRTGAHTPETHTAESLEVARLADHLGRGGYCFIAAPNCYTSGASPEFFLEVLRIVHASNRTPFQRACWLLGSLGSVTMNFGGRMAAALGLYGSAPTAEQLTGLAEQVRAEAPRYALRSDARGTSIQAFNVSPAYVLAKLEQSLGVTVEGDRKGLRTPRMQGPYWIPSELLLPTVADQLGATLSGKAPRYVITALSRPPNPAMDWERVWQVAGNWPMPSTPTLAGNLALIMIDHGQLSAIDLHTSGIVWKQSIGFAQNPPLVIGSSVYLGGGDNDMYVLRLADGQVVWTYQAPVPTSECGERPLHSVRALGPAGDAMVFASEDSNLYALDFATGKLVWVWSVSGMQASALEDGVFFAVGEHQVAAYRAATRSAVWSSELEPGGPLVRTSVRADHQNLVLHRGATVSMFDPTNGRRRWAAQTGRAGRPWGAPIVTGGRVIVAGGALDVHVYAYDQAVGSLLWRTALSADARLASAVSRERIAVTTSEGDLVILAADSGAILEQHALGLSQSGQPVEADDLVLVPSHRDEPGRRFGSGSLIAFRPGGAGG